MQIEYYRCVDDFYRSNPIFETLFASLAHALREEIDQAIIGDIRAEQVKLLATTTSVYEEPWL